MKLIGRNTEEREVCWAQQGGVGVCVFSVFPFILLDAQESNYFTRRGQHSTHSALTEAVCFYLKENRTGFIQTITNVMYELKNILF